MFKKPSLFFREIKLASLIFSNFFIFLFPSHSFSQTGSEQIKLNQMGFYPNAPKVAIVTAEYTSDKFYIMSASLRDTVFTGTLSDQKQSAYSSVKTRMADFSSFTGKGSFFVCVPGVGTSYTFAINDQIHRQLGKAALKAYFYQRVSMPLEEKYAGIWHRPAGHSDKVVYIHPSAADKWRPAGTIISTPGGWYDAGDYNKYIVNSAITMGTLLSAYEDFPDYFKKLSTNIPESKDDVPDIINEIIYNLRWMLTMQDARDGGVYNKCTNADFDGMVMPGVTKLPRYVVQKGTAATLDFASVTAQAARVLQSFKKQFPGLADSCLAASKKAWDWSKVHPDLEYNQQEMNAKFQPQITTGGYGDNHFEDEWLWAAAELYITTKEKKYFELVEKRIKDSVSLPSWNNVGMLAYYSLLRFENRLPSYTTNGLRMVKAKVIEMADSYIARIQANAFATVMGQSVRDYNWGGNANAANQGILLIRAYLLSTQKKYLDGALTNLDYLCGRNATGYSFITGYGSKSPMHPHHRPSVADGIMEPVPGFLVGGPNPGMQDHSNYAFTEPETAYTDDSSSYASNEIAINWNAPLVYLANALEALQQKAGYFKK